MLLSKSMISGKDKGYSKQDIEKQIEQIEEQLASIHLKLRTKVDSEMWIQIQTKNNILNQANIEIQRLKQFL